MSHKKIKIINILYRTVWQAQFLSLAISITVKQLPAQYSSLDIPFPIPPHSMQK